jgi:hypothetical protein
MSQPGAGDHMTEMIPMKSFSVTTSIRATPQALWGILIDGGRWTEWNTTVARFDGTIAPGEKVTITVKANPGRAFPLTVSEFARPSRLVFSGGMPLGLFQGVRTFTLTPHSGGNTEFSMQEVYSGLLAPLITRSIPDLQPAFDEFAACLKRTAEGKA